MARNNYPQSKIEDIEPDAVREIVGSLKELHDLGKPETDAEVKERVSKYFEFCEDSGNRPGVETLCLSLHITRTTLFNWNNGIGCSKERQEIIQSAKAFIASYLEQATLRGRLNPASSCFLFKNWCNYSDSVSFEVTEQPKSVSLTASELPKLGEMATRKTSDLPTLDCSDC